MNFRRLFPLILIICLILCPLHAQAALITGGDKAVATSKTDDKDTTETKKAEVKKSKTKKITKNTKKTLVDTKPAASSSHVSPQAPVTPSTLINTPSQIKDNRTVTLNFTDVDIGVFIKYISGITGKQFIVDENVKGRVTVTGRNNITIDQAYNVLESVLQEKGYTTAPAGNFIKILPAVKEKKQETKTERQAVAPVVPAIRQSESQVKAPAAATVAVKPAPASAISTSPQASVTATSPSSIAALRQSATIQKPVGTSTVAPVPPAPVNTPLNTGMMGAAPQQAGKPAMAQSVVPAPTAVPGGAAMPSAASQQAPEQKASDAAVTISSAHPQTPQVTQTPQAPQTKDSRYITMDFDGVEIQTFTRFISEITGKNFVIDDKVKGKVTILSPKKVSVEDAYKVFESVLEVNGFTAVASGDVIKIIPMQLAKEKRLEIRTGDDDIIPEDKMVTQIVSLEYASPDEIKKVLDPLISKTSAVISYTPAGMLVISDLLSNVKKLKEIVAALDVEGVGELISYIPLKYVSSAEMAKSLLGIFQQYKGIAPIKAVSYDYTNSIILVASEADSERVKKLIALMDKSIEKGSTLIHVYRLQNAIAEDLAKILMNLPKDTKDAQKAKMQVLSKDVQVMADKASNSLIITADHGDYIILESVIKKLDLPRPMVYIEALIMEVNSNKDFQIGVEWRGAKDIGNADINPALGKDAQALGYAGFKGSSAVIPSISSTGAVTGLASGLSLGVIGTGIQIGSVVFPNLGAMIQFYQNDQDVSIISTPQIMTLNNEEAEINVGENVPYVTRQEQTGVGVVGATNYSSYEYKDVSTILKITPNVNEDDFVRLKIDQQVTKLKDPSSTSTTPTTLKRTAKTTVTIKNNQTVVLGGLIGEDNNTTAGKMPFLGDIPLLGWLFKYQSKSMAKTNLFIFITPHIVRTFSEAAALSKKKKDESGGFTEGGTIKMYDKKPGQKQDKKEKQAEK